MDIFDIICSFFQAILLQTYMHTSHSFYVLLFYNARCKLNVYTYEKYSGPKNHTYCHILKKFFSIKNSIWPIKTKLYVLILTRSEVSHYPGVIIKLILLLLNHWTHAVQNQSPQAMLRPLQSTSHLELL